MYINSDELDLSNTYVDDVPVTPVIRLVFSTSLDTETVTEGVILLEGDQVVNVNYGFSSEDKILSITPTNKLDYFTNYKLILTNELKGYAGQSNEPRELGFKTVAGELELVSLLIDNSDVKNIDVVPNVPLTLDLTMEFTVPVNRNSLQSAVSVSGADLANLNYTYSNNDQTVTLTSTSPLQYLSKYAFKISKNLESVNGASFGGFSNKLFTVLDSTYKFPEISDEELLTKVQQQTFKYFWDFAHPASGLARERSTSNNLVTIGGSGFGVMTIPVAIERGFITRGEGVERLAKIVDFLGTADRFHGVWPHWLEGNTGKTKPFSQKDDGGDIVETAFMIEGLLTVRQYLDPAVAEENEIINKITTLWEEVEWDWYTQGENSITWHWSPNYGFEKNMKVGGWNEALIVYVLAAASPTHSISSTVYHQGWARNGNLVNGNTYYNIKLPLGHAYGGPLFFEHYSFVGLDPRNLSDQYANYWEQARAHTLINKEYCVDNPHGYVGYSDICWGLTASDNHEGYSAHSPTNDKGVITPTAALSSIPFTPDESMEALKHFYYHLGDRLWGDYGFYDAFNITQEWTASSFLAIDQGPIVVMIENYRTALCWDLFMQDTEVQNGLTKLGFTY
ncbi:hypothetical protein E9993_09405 [Labilibacter sediminis]|nr:hypothetical protein E9993_09405 [Labilibacter sediminis]